MSTTIAGVPFSDQLAALLDHAQAQDGWRVEPDSRARGKATSVVVYPADKAHSPIKVNERGAKFNKAHYENYRRELYRAGLPLLPGDEKPDGVMAVEVAGREEIGGVGLSELFAASGRAVDEKGVIHLSDSQVQDLLDDPKTKPSIAATLSDGILRAAGLGTVEAELGGRLIYSLLSWTEAHGTDRMDAAIDSVSKELAGRYETEINDALQMAQDAEATRDRAIADLAKAEERERKARKDCGEALRRAEAAEAAQREAEAALAPLRAYLGAAK